MEKARKRSFHWMSQCPLSWVMIMAMRLRKSSFKCLRKLVSSSKLWHGGLERLLIDSGVTLS